jgi:hypothetical protein
MPIPVTSYTYLFSIFVLEGLQIIPLTMYFSKYSILIKKNIICMELLFKTWKYQVGTAVDLGFMNHFTVIHHFTYDDEAT